MKYDQFPKKRVKNHTQSIIKGWDQVLDKIIGTLEEDNIIIETYPGVNEDNIVANLKEKGISRIIRTSEFFLSKDKLDFLLKTILTDDRVFGHMTSNNIEDFFDMDKVKNFKNNLKGIAGRVAIVGMGATLVGDHKKVVYFNLPRWEIQLRYRNGLPNYFSSNPDEDILKKYKQGYFLEWRIADKIKSSVFDEIVLMIDDSNSDCPKMISGDDYRSGLKEVVTNPFRLVPFFDPGVWGGQWMKDKFNLDENKSNYAWSFDGVPEENSILLQIEEEVIALPAIDAVLMYPKELLGHKVYHRFGAEFPIRFDLLDTMDGQNLSLQVHPTYEYIRKNFGMTVTQEESYYVLDCKNDGVVYLGLKENIDKDEMIDDLRLANDGKKDFDDGKFVNKFTAKKHDHYLIPPGTIHCSGTNTMILEISTSAYIFTFKLWDWGRLGLDGKPRPVHIDHASQVIDWERDTTWTEKNLVNTITIIEDNVDVKVERTGLHDYQYLETYRYWINNEVEIKTNGTLNVLNLVEGSSAIVFSSKGLFDDYEVHFAETFIIPASIGEYSIKPRFEDERIAVIRAFVRDSEV